MFITTKFPKKLSPNLLRLCFFPKALFTFSYIHNFYESSPLLWISFSLISLTRWPFFHSELNIPPCILFQHSHIFLLPLWLTPHCVLHPLSPPCCIFRHCFCYGRWWFQDALSIMVHGNFVPDLKSFSVVSPRSNYVLLQNLLFELSHLCSWVVYLSNSASCRGYLQIFCTGVRRKPSMAMSIICWSKRQASKKWRYLPCFISLESSMQALGWLLQYSE